MTLTLKTEAPPLRIEESGAIRVGKTRVLLELVIYAHKQGATPERIVEMFPSLNVPDVYAVIAYYLRHPTEIDEYIEQQEKKGAANEKRFRTEQADFIKEMKTRMQARRKG